MSVRWTVTSRVAAIVGAASVAITAGGIWLIRNWILWGSPLGATGLSLFGVDVFDGAPHEPTTYLSVVGDMERDPAYDVLARTAHFAFVWLTPWFLAALVPLVMYVVDLSRAGLEETSRHRRAARAAALMMIVGSGVPMIWLLAGAPWTSLEWTRGYSLRYILPWLAALPLLAFIGCFPNSYRWIRHDRTRAVAGATVLVAGVWTLLAAQGGNSEPPRLTLTTGLGIGAMCLAFYGVARWRPRAVPAVTACLVAALATLWAVQAAHRNDALVTAEEAQTDAPHTPAEEVYAAALDFERRSRQSCSARRFFILTRFDEPMALQSPVLRNRVYYAARDVRVTARSAPIASCDYLITSRGVLGTDKGRALIAVLNPGGRTADIAEAGSFVLMAPR
jgi:hypothetical protein